MKTRLTERRVLEIHIRMWDLLAEHPWMSKRDAVRELNLPDDMDSDCAACHYVNQELLSTCTVCPVWSRHHSTCMSVNPRTGHGGEFDRWCRADCSEDRRRAAKAIAALGREVLAELAEDEI